MVIRDPDAGHTGFLDRRDFSGQLVFVPEATDRGVLTRRDVNREIVSPQLGARLEVAARLELKANWSLAERPPDFMELFGNQGSVLGNPDLRPERARNADLGLAWSGSPAGRLTLSVDLAHFETRTEDLVVYVRHSQSSVRAENISRARASGRRRASKF